MSKEPTGDQGSTSNAGEWYAEGLQFQCTQCGNCCTGPPGYVWFTEDEGRTIASSLRIAESEFYEKYARRDKSHWSLKEHKTEHGYDCVFLDRESVPSRAICKLYDSRPSQCRTWPFWPENLQSPETWENTRRQTPCPGINEGPLISFEQIRIQRDLTQ